MESAPLNLANNMPMGMANGLASGNMTSGMPNELNTNMAQGMTQPAAMGNQMMPVEPQMEGMWPYNWNTWTPPHDSSVALKRKWVLGANMNPATPPGNTTKLRSPNRSHLNGCSRRCGAWAYDYLWPREPEARSRGEQSMATRVVAARTRAARTAWKA